MKAIVCTHFGLPTKALVLKDLPKPSPGKGEVLIKIRATAINDWDWNYVRGQPLEYRLIFGLFRPRVAIFGAELAGDIEAVGEGVTTFKAGDAVYGDVSEAGFGGFAQYAIIPARALQHKPPKLSYVEAASIPHAWGLAYQALVTLGGIKKSERVLINGGGGGVGTFGVQLAKQYNAHVTGVDSSDKFETMKSYGFDHLVDYKKEDFGEHFNAYDLILDAKSTRSAKYCAGALAEGGRYITVGGDTSRLLQIALGGWRFTNKKLKVLPLKPNLGLEQLEPLLKTEALRYPIDGPYPLEDIPRRLQYFGEAKHQGKVVIEVAH